MEALLLPACVVVFFAAMAWRIKLLPPDKRRRAPKERLKFIRILVAALLALMAVGYRLERTNESLNGQGKHEPGVIERIVMRFAN